MVNGNILRRVQLSCITAMRANGANVLAFLVPDQNLVVVTIHDVDIAQLVDADSSQRGDVGDLQSDCPTVS